MTRRIAFPLLFLILAGCNPQDASDLKHEVGSLARTSGRALGNAEVVARVNAQLAQQKDIEVSGLHVEANKGSVTLSGHVSSAHERRLMMKQVAEIQGVDKVIDHLRVEKGRL